MISFALRITVLLFASLIPLTHGFIMCKCDTPECQANMNECKAEFYCYVAFRPSRPNERRTSASSKWMYGAGSQLFIAEHRGCVLSDQLQMCNEHSASGGGGFGNLNIDEEGHDHPPIIRCCSDNRCNVGQELGFTQAELDGRQFFLNPKISDVEPGLDFPMFSPMPPKRQYDPHHLPSLQDTTKQSVKKVESTAVTSVDRYHRERASYANDVPFNQWPSGTSFPPVLSPFFSSPRSPSSSLGFDDLQARVGDSASKRDENHSPLSQLQPQSLQESEALERGSMPVIMLQPLHVAIGVCLIILTLVAVLLHVVIVLHRRHRRLKCELMKQTQKASVMNHQQQSSHWPFIAMSQWEGEHVDLHLPPSVSMHENGSHKISNKYNARQSLRSFFLSCLWKQHQIKTLPSNVYVEDLSQQAASMAAGMQLKQCMPHEQNISTQTIVSCHGILTTSNSLHSSVSVPPTLHSSHTLNQLHPQHQPVLNLSYPTEQDYHTSIIKNVYGTGSSISEGSGNNPSTTESSLPTQFSAVAGWSSVNKNGGFPHNGLALNVHTTNLERPSLSGSSKAGSIITPDFETRRAKVALPPTLLGGDRAELSVYSPSNNTTNLALFRSATQPSEAYSLVTPYAQLPFSPSHDQYDTPEQIFGTGDTSNPSSTSLDGFCQIQNHASSNPTTNSSILHSYCEHGVPVIFGGSDL